MEQSGVAVGKKARWSLPLRLDRSRVVRLEIGPSAHTMGLRFHADLDRDRARAGVFAGDGRVPGETVEVETRTAEGDVLTSSPDLLILKGRTKDRPKPGEDVQVEF